VHLFAFWDPEITPLNVLILHGHAHSPEKTRLGSWEVVVS
jgi:hypothetical protein